MMLILRALTQRLSVDKILLTINTHLLLAPPDAFGPFTLGITRRSPVIESCTIGSQIDNVRSREA